MAKLTRWAIFLRAFIVTLVAAHPVRVGSAPPAEEQAWRQARAENSARGYYVYLSRYPSGEYVQEAVEALDRLGALGNASPGRQIPSLGGSGAPSRSVDPY